MNEQILDVIANVAIALAGFSGLVVVFRSRGSRGWSATELRFLWFLIGDSLLVLLFALLPFPMSLANWSQDTIWAIGNSLLGTWFFIGNVLAVRGDIRDRRLHRESGVRFASPALFLIYAGALLMSVGMWLSALDIGLQRGQAMYVFGLVVLLGFAAFEFLYFIGLMAKEDAHSQ